MGGVAATAAVAIASWAWVWCRQPLLRSCWRAIRLLLRLMLTGQDEGDAKPERVLISVEDYPGSLPDKSCVEEGERLRQAGNTAYGAGLVEEAAQLYTRAVLFNPSDHLAYSNRSACWLRLDRSIDALDDAELCVKLVPQFAKGFLRKGAAERRLNRRVDAQASLRKGLGLDPASSALQQALRELQTDTSGGLQATIYHVLFVSPHLQMDRLFQVLEDPDGLTSSYVEQHKAELDAQFECLTQTLRVDVGLLLASPVLQDAYDRVTFACGQILQWAPEAVSRHLTQARRIVEGLGLALRCGWRIHHGVAKFSANALTILATSEGANDELRREAVRLLLGGMLRWLYDPTPEPEDPPEDRDVCGCTFLSPRLSAATWLERLFEHGTRTWVREECERFPDVTLLLVHLCLVVRDERAVPLGLPCLLRLPCVASQVMACTAIIDLSTCNREVAGKRDSRGWLTRQKAKAGAGGSETTGPAVATAQSEPSCAIVDEQHGGDAEMLQNGQGGERPVVDEVDMTKLAGQQEDATQDIAKMRRREVSSDDVVLSDSTLQRWPAPTQRLGEWMMASLGYLLIFIDDDALFAANACSALHRMACAVPDGVARLTTGLWMGLPLLERLSVLACQHTAALELLEAIAHQSRPARIAMCSLAGALAGLPREEDAAANISHAASGADSILAPMEVEGGTDHPHGSDASVSEGEVAGDADHDHDGLGKPSWIECYYELRDELWAASDGVTQMLTLRPAAPSQSLVRLDNFDDAAPQVPVAGLMSVSTDESTGEAALQVSIVPAVWNPRFNDHVEGPLSTCGMQELGCPSWRVQKEGAIVLLLRSTIQRTPVTPDWASAVWLCAEAGARAVVVVNDLADDGPTRPAFRMGLFGSPPPPVAAFMVSGEDGDQLFELTSRAASSSPAQHPAASVRSVHSESSSGAGAAAPAWPLVLRGPPDVAQAWSLVETVHRAAPSPSLAEELADLAGRMGLPEKRVWLTRRLQRTHRGDTDADEASEPPLAFLECDRGGDQLLQLRTQLADKTGIAAPDITGDFEVRFRDESSVGSAVMREWMDLVAQQAFLNSAKHLLISYDNGVTFLPDPAAPFLNAQWKGDFELLGRLLGLALWHQVTLDLPLHPYVCELLLNDGDWPQRCQAEDLQKIASIDADLHKHKVQWVLSNDVSALGYDMPFTDVLVSGGSCCDTANEESLSRLPSIVTAADALEGDADAGGAFQLRQFTSAEIVLVAGGAEIVVTEANKHDFVSALLHWRLHGSMRAPLQAMLTGLRATVPSAVIAEARRMLSPSEVHALLAGSRDIDVSDWEKNTRTVGGLTMHSQEVRWFWQIIRRWATEGRQHLLQDLLQFATGSRRVPVGGFAQLVGFNGGKHLFTLAKGAHLGPTSLPTSHACICTLDLPPWDSLEAASQKLQAATEVGRLRFDEGTARSNGDD